MKKKMFSCIGGCKRKIIGEKKTGGSCVEGLWSCMRCLMSKKNRYLEKEREQEPTDLIEFIWEFQRNRIDDQRCSFNTTSKNQVENAEHKVEVSTPGAEEDKVSGISRGSASDDTYEKEQEPVDFIDLIWKFQSHRIDDQRCSFNTTSKTQVGNAEHTVEVSTPGAEEENVSEISSGSASDDTYETAPESSDEGSYVECADEKLSQRSTRKSSVRSSEGTQSIGSPSPITKQGDYSYLKLEELEYFATLGKGAYGRVELVTLKSDPSRSFALKYVGKQQTVANDEQKDVCQERRLMMATNSPFIARMYRTFRDHKYVYMMMEPCLGGELFEVLNNRKHLKNKTARFYIACVVLALQYLHGNGIVYRDIKLENLVMDSRGYLKLVDFGMAKEIGTGGKTWTLCGSPNYIAPEVIQDRGYGKEVDYWSLGVVAFLLLTGRYPFDGPSPVEIFDVILQGIKKVKFPRTIKKHAKGFIKGMCNDNPAERLGSRQDSEIKQHRWFRGFDWEELTSQTMIPPIDPKVQGPTDCRHFPTEEFGRDTCVPPDEMSGWDIDF